jgi:hypothetical protein
MVAILSRMIACSYNIQGTTFRGQHSGNIHSVNIQ